MSKIDPSLQLGLMALSCLVVATLIVNLYVLSAELPVGMGAVLFYVLYLASASRKNATPSQHIFRWGLAMVMSTVIELIAAMVFHV